MPQMNRAQAMDIPGGLLPLPRPLMTGEVLDAAFRLFRAGLLRCLPYSGLAVLFLRRDVHVQGKLLVGFHLALAVVLTFGWVVGLQFHHWRAMLYFGLPAAVATGAVLVAFPRPRTRTAVAASLRLAPASLRLNRARPTTAPRVPPSPASIQLR